MADKKISALTASTTPLAGTEVLPIVQSSSTVKVAVSDLTAGRIVSSIGSNITGVGSKVTFDTTGLAAANYIYTTSNFNLTLYAGRGSTVQVDLTTDNVDSYVGGVRQSRLGTTGLTLDTGNLIQGTAAKGVNFTANTPAAGMTSQLLNWYEEGTWTPVVTANVGSITTYTASGRYTRIGRAIVLSCKITITDNGTGADFLKITGMPFNALTSDLESGSVMEVSAVGFSGAFYFSNTTTLAMRKADATYPGGTGYVLACQITYQI